MLEHMIYFDNFNPDLINDTHTILAQC